MRVSSGIVALDRAIAGGYPEGGSVLVCGDPGSGKTILALQFLAAGAAASERGILVLVDQKPRHVIEDARAFGWDLERWTADKTLRLLDASPFLMARGQTRRELEPAAIAADLAAQIDAFGARRLVIDHFSSLVPDALHVDVPAFVRALMAAFEYELACTTLLTATRSSEVDALPDLAGQVASGILELSVASRRETDGRRLRVRKLRGTPINQIEIALGITAGKGWVG